MFPIRFDLGDPDNGMYPDPRQIGYFSTFVGGGASPATNETPTPGAVSSSGKEAAQKHELTDAERLDQFGSALQEIGQGLAPLNRPQDAAPLEAMQRQLQQQQDAFAQQARFGQMPGPYRLVAPVTLNVPPAAARPGDRAIGALASLYR